MKTKFDSSVGEHVHNYNLHSRGTGLFSMLETFVKQGVQILAVDDEPLIRHCMKLLLEHEGHEVCAVDGGEALWNNWLNASST
jgi:hypothetical protein